MEDLIESQKATLGIQDFLNSAKNYTVDVFPEINLDNFLTSAISRKNRYRCNFTKYN